jgi:hypothetical protein
MNKQKNCQPYLGLDTTRDLQEGKKHPGGPLFLSYNLLINFIYKLVNYVSRF